MSRISDESSSRFLIQSFFLGLAACGFLIILMDLALRVSGLASLLEPLAASFFPEVENGLGLLVTSLILLGFGYLPSVFRRRS